MTTEDKRGERLVEMLQMTRETTAALADLREMVESRKDENLRVTTQATAMKVMAVFASLLGVLEDYRDMVARLNEATNLLAGFAMATQDKVDEMPTDVLVLLNGLADILVPD